MVSLRRGAESAGNGEGRERPRPGPALRRDRSTVGPAELNVLIPAGERPLPRALSLFPPPPVVGPLCPAAFCALPPGFLPFRNSWVAQPRQPLVPVAVLEKLRPSAPCPRGRGIPQPRDSIPELPLTVGLGTCSPLRSSSDLLE